MKPMTVGLIVAVSLIVGVSIGCSGSGNSSIRPEQTNESEPEYRGRLPLEEVKQILSGGMTGYITIRDGDRPSARIVSYECSAELQKVYVKSIGGDDAWLLETVRKSPQVMLGVDKHTDIPAKRAHASDPTPTSWTSINIFGTATVRAESIEITPEIITAKRVGMSEFQAGHSPMIILDESGELLDVVAQLPQNNLKVIAYRAKNAAMGNQASWEGVDARETGESVLHRNLTGRFHTLGAEYPYSVPVNHTYYNGRIYIHSRGSNSLKVLNMKENWNVCYTAEWFGNHIPWTSVIVSGTARLIYTDDEEYRSVGRIVMNRLQGSADGDPNGAEMSAAGSGAILIEITPLKVLCKTNLVADAWYRKMPGTKTEKVK